MVIDLKEVRVPSSNLAPSLFFLLFPEGAHSNCFRAPQPLELWGVSIIWGGWNIRKNI